MTIDLQLAVDNAELAILRMILKHVLDTPCDQRQGTCPTTSPAFEEVRSAAALLCNLTSSSDLEANQTVSNGFVELALSAAHGESGRALVKRAHDELSKPSFRNYRSDHSLITDIDAWIALGGARSS